MDEEEQIESKYHESKIANYSNITSKMELLTLQFQQLKKKHHQLLQSNSVMLASHQSLNSISNSLDIISGTSSSLK